MLLKARTRHTRYAAVPFVLALLVTDSSWRSWPLINEVYQWAGYFALVLCVMGRAWCSAYIGGRKNYELTAIGPYSVVRNPLYVFSFIGVVGIGLCTGTVTYLAILTLLFAGYYAVVVWREEKFLAATFGDDFANYTARVPRWIPDFSLWSDTEEIVVKPRFIFFTFRDSALFFLAFPLLDLIAYFHGIGILPVLWRLP
ncbi:MAG: isoprenylcysteine carboxylmethyltransferase family protein [Acidobacteriia bacterium]|nr:isoprenylcysteine carboxylmethyltransferase family protein [Terriglobia bacterium]